MSDYQDETINPNKRSKINAVSVIMLLLGFISIWGILPAELNERLEQTVLLIGPMLVIVFRSFFTGRKKRGNKNANVDAAVDCSCSNRYRKKPVFSDRGSCYYCDGLLPETDLERRESETAR